MGLRRAHSMLFQNVILLVRSDGRAGRDVGNSERAGGRWSTPLLHRQFMLPGVRREMCRRIRRSSGTADICDQVGLMIGRRVDVLMPGRGERVR